ncbi:hypothetical protein [Rhizobium sp. 1399]|uniref:hypothetical protein n=1 Tax=Rhizobium sp. 1399 TaxID=2817758 RepID=UPI00285CF85A|nr:hypothetical protein [Rhizobium sp. 1399]MDR6664281.1 hypothetical protein [Rhizobium sp. 1399]
MSFTIGLRFYRISIRKKGEKTPLEMGAGCTPCDFLDYVSDFVARRIEPTVEVATQRTWFFEPIATPSIRVVHGYINYGTHGFESKFKDVRTRKQKYKREATDLEEIPLYFQMWAPSASKYALMAFQSFQGRSCINYVRSAMIADFANRYPDFQLSFIIVAPSSSFLADAPVKSVTFMKPRVGSDRFDRVLGKQMDEVDYEVTVRAKRRGGMISSYKDLGKLVGPGDNGFVFFDGHSYEGVKADVKIGGKRRVVGVYGSGMDAGLIDVSENVKRDGSGHPTLHSIQTEVDSLMEDFYGSIHT